MIWQVQDVVPVHPVPVVLVQNRPEQHAWPAEQAWPSCGHVAPVLHVPLVAPDGTSHVKPEQQSADVMHWPAAGWHAAGGRQTLLVPPSGFAPQIFEQQSPAAPHPEPLLLHPASPASGAPCVTWQAWPNSPATRHDVPAQQFDAPGVQSAPTGSQVEPVQTREPPSPPGRQSRPEQH